MKIYEVTDKKKYLPLLLLADEQKNMIDRYIKTSQMYVLDDNAIIGEITVRELSRGILEIKNLAIFPEYQRKGYGKALIRFICEKYKGRYSVLQVGTGDSLLTVPFYEKCGFIKSHIVKNFFVENYDHPIIENGKRLIDMVYLKKTI
ncbi:MAG: GNAT family N-acetyltransferase [Clostridia bacterium]|nr:GNAT family N-acetyltransferase [Clostridia bacterium]